MKTDSNWLGGALGLALCAFITSAHADEVDRYIEAKLKRQNIPGLALAVVREGRIVKAAGYGLADIELQVPATERSVFQWASVSKQFTAAGVMLLVREGKLRLEDPVRLHYTNAPPAWSNVTVRHLLTHTSGIKGYTELPDFFRTVRKDYQPEEIIGLVTDRPLDFDPGEKWAYSNTGYYLLGLIIEQASGQAYGDFMAGRIFRPLGMDTARLNHQFEIITNRVTGYVFQSNRLWRAEFASPTQPFSAGALVGTVLDLAKWDAALYTEQLLPTADWQLMWAPVRLNDGGTHPYGYGFQTGNVRGHRFVGHGGGIHGFTSFIVRFVEDKLTVIVLINAGADPQGIAVGVAGHYLPGLTLGSIEPPLDTDSRLDGQLKQCLIDLGARKDSEMLTEGFRRNFARSQRRHGALQQDLKSLKSFTFLIEEMPAGDEREVGGATVQRFRRYRLMTGDGPRYYSFALTQSNEVASVHATDE